MKNLLLIVLSLCIPLPLTRAQQTAATDGPEILHSHKITYSLKRIKLLKAYAEAHYSEYYRTITGSSEWPGVQINPGVIVIHYTAIPTLEETIREFKPDTLRGRPDIEKSGKANVGVQFIIDQDGAIYQTMPDNYFARHCIGLNHCAIGIENVGMADISEAGLRSEPPTNKELTLAQVKANAKLVRHLKQKYPGITILIGHREYRQLEDSSHPGHRYFHENDPDYRTQKSDPGERFLQALRHEIADLLAPGTNGQVFK